MSTNYYYNKVGNKIYYFIRTDSGRLFDITDCLPDSNGVLWKARLVSDDDLYSKRLRGRASNVRRLRKQKTMNLDDNIRRGSGGGLLK